MSSALEPSVALFPNCFGLHSSRIGRAVLSDEQFYRTNSSIGRTWRSSFVALLLWQWRGRFAMEFRRQPVVGRNADCSFGGLRGRSLGKTPTGRAFWLTSEQSPAGAEQPFSVLNIVVSASTVSSPTLRCWSKLCVASVWVWKAWRRCCWACRKKRCGSDVLGYLSILSSQTGRLRRLAVAG